MNLVYSGANIGERLEGLILRAWRSPEHVRAPEFQPEKEPETDNFATQSISSGNLASNSLFLADERNETDEI
jgi:hypothetical protein